MTLWTIKTPQGELLEDCYDTDDLMPWYFLGDFHRDMIVDAPTGRHFDIEEVRRPAMEQGFKLVMVTLVELPVDGDEVMDKPKNACFTCGKWALLPDSVHTCHQNPVIACLKWQLAQAEAKIQEKEKTHE